MRGIRPVLDNAFVRDSSIYLAGGVATALLPLALTPVLTRYLTPTDYGVVGTASVLVPVVGMVIGLNASGLVVRSEFDENREAQRRLVSTLLSVSLAVSAALTILTWLGAGILETTTKFPASWAPVLAPLALASVIQGVYLTLLQAKRRPRAYTAVQIVLTSSQLVFALLFVVGFGMDWRGRILANLLSGALLTALCLYGLAVRLRVVGFVFARQELAGIIAFGLPLVPHVIGGWVMILSPRLYLNHLATLADTGLYSLGFTLASPIAMLVGAGNQAYVPTLFARLSRPESLDRVRLCRLLIIAAVALMSFAGAYGLAARWFLPVLVGPRFHAAAPYVFWLALGFGAQGVYFIFANFVVFSKNTKAIAWRADFLAGLVLIAATPLLIGLNGPVGAAQATFLGFSVSTVGAFVASMKSYPMPWARAAARIFSWRPAAPQVSRGS